ncbi:MAG: transglycosylase domain-containing protein [Nanoarchaeota archaeon]|nr:transglycosylase domain-containing protein [Nanoarchaeota archaeon]
MNLNGQILRKILGRDKKEYIFSQLKKTRHLAKALKWGCLGTGALAAINFMPGTGQHCLEKYAARNMYKTSIVQTIPDLPKPYGSSAKIVDTNNKIIKSYGSRIFLKEIPEKAREAVLACEDHYFRRHDNYPWYINEFMIHEGVSVYNLCGAVIDTLKGNKRGGSTIEMQNVKNILSYPRRNYCNKIKEIIQAYIISDKFGKDWNLDFYINNVSMGNRISGLPAAADIYFGKKLRDLNLQQLVTLGSFIPNHNRQIALYEIAKGKDIAELSTSVRNHAKKSINKINLALKHLRNLDEITDEEFRTWEIRDEQSIRNIGFIKLNINYYGIEEWTARNITKEICSNEYEIDGRTVKGRDLLLNEKGHIIIKTDVDTNLINDIKDNIDQFLSSKNYDRILRRRNRDTWKKDMQYYIDKGIKPPYADFEGFMDFLHKHLNIGVIAVNQRGNIVVYIGGKEFGSQNNLQKKNFQQSKPTNRNIIHDLVNQKTKVNTGSTIKPIIAYYAMALGNMDLQTKLKDWPLEHKYNQSEKKMIWMPRNWYKYDERHPKGKKYSLLDAQVKSINTIFARLYTNSFIKNALLTGFDKVGLEYNKEDARWWPYGIGAFDANVQKWLGIYSAFLDGYYQEPSFVERILINGEIIYNKYEDLTKSPILLFDNEQIRKREMNVLYEVCNRGLKRAIRPKFRDYIDLISGKTGTESEQKSSLFISHFNPYKDRKLHSDKTLTMMVIATTNTGGYKRVGFSTECPVRLTGEIYKGIYQKELK